MTMRERVAQAIDGDLIRQASVQAGMGCTYYPAADDPSGVAGADMHIVLAELADAVIPLVLAEAAKVARESLRSDDLHAIGAHVATAIERLGER